MERLGCQISEELKMCNSNHVACKVAHLRGVHRNYMQIESTVILSGAWSCARNITRKVLKTK
jgi:hypothetical protein